MLRKNLFLLKFHLSLLHDVVSFLSGPSCLFVTLKFVVILKHSPIGNMKGPASMAMFRIIFP